MGALLIVDDDQCFSDLLVHKLRGATGVSEVQWVDSVAAAMQAIGRNDFDVVLLDICLPDGSGLDILSYTSKLESAPEVIVLTGSPGAGAAEQAIRYGARDYVRKSEPLSAVEEMVKAAVEARRLKRHRNWTANFSLGAFVAESPAMRKCVNVAAKASLTDVNVLLYGETGTGKELFASAIHRSSTRRKGKFVVVDCASIPETLAESVLLGHEKGAFTGASSVQEGLFKQADGGTLFLDEVGELPLSVQKVFLRALEEHAFRPIGGKHETESSFRLIAATNRNLEQMVKEGRFRADLLFRLKACVIELPPLKARKEDIALIARRRTARKCEEWGIEEKELSHRFVEALKIYDWPGNVRELLHAVDAAIAAAVMGGPLSPCHLPEEIRILLARKAAGGEEERQKELFTEGLDTRSLEESRERAIAEAEERYLRNLLSSTGWDVRAACRISNLSRSRFYALLKKYGLSGRNQKRSLACPVSQETFQH